MRHPNFDFSAAMHLWQKCVTSAEESGNLFVASKALSNIALAYKSQADCQTAFVYIQRAWVATNQYLRSVSEAHASNTWLKLALSAVDAPELVAMGPRRTQSEPHKNGSQLDSIESALGPPIILWLFQLLTNIGNIYFALAKFELALKSYDMCHGLVESALQEFRLPGELHTISTTARPGARNQLSGLPEKIGSFRLSAFHKHALICQARCLTHIGCCYHELGLSIISLKYQKLAVDFLELVRKRVPAVVRSRAFAVRSSSITANSDSTEFSIAMAGAMANLGNSYLSTGDLGKSAHWQSECSKMLGISQEIAVVGRAANNKETAANNKETAVAHTSEQIALQNMNVGCVNLAMGNAAKSIQTIHDIELEKDPFDVQCTSDVLGAYSNFRAGLAILYGQAKRQRAINDRYGLSVTLINIGNLY